MADFQRGRPAIEMTGQTVNGWFVVRRAESVNRLARWLVRHTCEHQCERYMYGCDLRGSLAPRFCDGCRPARGQRNRPRRAGLEVVKPPPAHREHLTPNQLRLRALDGGLTQKDFDAVDAERPRTRGECAGATRPCPFVSCRHHLYLDAHPGTGRLTMNFPTLEPHELAESCSLDLADQGESELSVIAAAMNFSRQMADQYIVRSEDRLRRRLKLWEGHTTVRREVAL